MELVETHHIRAARVQDVNDILKRRVTFAARREWIARVRKSGIPPHVWTMTAEEQNEMKTELGWTREDMVNANVRVASLGAQEPEDALEALIAQEELFNATDLDPASVKTLSRVSGLAPFSRHAHPLPEGRQTCLPEFSRPKCWSD